MFVYYVCYLVYYILCILFVQWVELFNFYMCIVIVLCLHVVILCVFFAECFLLYTWCYYYYLFPWLALFNFGYYFNVSIMYLFIRVIFDELHVFEYYVIS